MATTIYRLAEECLRILSGGNPDVASNVAIQEIKIAVGQVACQLLKTEYFSVNLPFSEMIPNGAMIATYDNILVTSISGRAVATLPIKPMKLPRNIGLYSVYDANCEYIPVEIGQMNMLDSQPLLSSLLTTTYENYGDRLLFRSDITVGNDTPTYVSARMVILDISQYDDYTPLPVSPELEWQIKQEVLKIYGVEPTKDVVVDPGRSQQKGIPINQQSQT